MNLLCLFGQNFHKEDILFEKSASSQGHFSSRSRAFSHIIWSSSAVQLSLNYRCLHFCSLVSEHFTDFSYMLASLNSWVKPICCWWGSCDTTESSRTSKWTLSDIFFKKRRPRVLMRCTFIFFRISRNIWNEWMNKHLMLNSEVKSYKMNYIQVEFRFV